MIGDDPQALAAERPPSSYASVEPRAPRRSNGNFNVIFEITPASLSTTDSMRREEQQRVNTRQVTDEYKAPPVDSPLLPESPVDSSVQAGLAALLRGPYKLNNAFQEEKVLLMLSYPVLLIVGHDLASLPLIPLCSYLRMRKPTTARERNQYITTRKIVLSWQATCIDDLVWLLELMEPIYDLQSVIQFEVSVYVHHRPSNISALTLFYDCIEELMNDPFPTKLPLDSRVALYFGMRDWKYQLETIGNETSDERVGVMVDGPHSSYRQIYDWIQSHAVDRFDFLPLGIISI